MVPRVFCPDCGAVHQLPEDLIGQTTTCTNCGSRFLVPRPDIRGVATRGAAPPPLPTPPPPPPRPAPVPPPIPLSPYVEDEPAENDEDEIVSLAPVRRSRLPLIVAAIAGLALLGGGVGLAYFAGLWPKKADSAVAQDDGKPADNGGPADEANKSVTPLPKKDPADPKGNTAGPKTKDVAPGTIEPDPGPLARADGIRPAPLTADREERALPETVGDVCAGGAGRYLILALPKLGKLGVFDVNEAKVVKYLPLAEADAKFAAGRDKLIIVAPKAGTIERYSLTTFEKEVTAALPYTGKLHAVLMGSATDGPVLVAMSGMNRERAASTYVFFDQKTLKELVCDWQGDGPDRDRNLGFGDTQVVSRLSADGRVLTWWLPGLSSGQYAMRIDGTRLKGPYDGGQNGYALPGPDGEAVYTPGRVLSAEMKRAGPEAKYNPDGGTYFLPAAHGRWYLAVQRYRRRDLPSNAPLEIALDLYLQGADRPLATVRDLKGLALPETGISSGPDQWLHFVPAANLLVAIPPARDKLVLYKLDIEAALAQSETDYLVVLSTPPPTATRGKAYTYPLEVKARKGGVKVKVDAGPPGMKIDGKGVLTWDVPKSFDDNEASVILTVTDATGQEIFHTFRVVVE